MSAGSSPTTEAGYTVRAVADHLGIPTATLRSWNQRYGIGPTRSRPGTHRLYSETDIAQVQRMLTLVRGGASPAGAAAAVRGPVIALGDRAALLDTAFALDSAALTAQLHRHVREFGVVQTWNALCRPAFADIVGEQLRGVGCIDVEHLLSWCITAVLQRIEPPEATVGSATVLACTSGETHALPLEVLRAALAERGVPALMLGADVPTGALADTFARPTPPATAVLWSQQESTALVSAARTCAAGGARVFVAGPGWAAVRLPPRVEVLDTLEAAIEQLR